jgi:hypothetical protein
MHWRQLWTVLNLAFRIRRKPAETQRFTPGNRSQSEPPSLCAVANGTYLERRFRSDKETLKNNKYCFGDGLTSKEAGTSTNGWQLEPVSSSP